jgi:succinate dehydrogenase / fumarate reductase cytochrome b subunit
MTVRARPLSPHLGYYRPQIGSVTSIVHRITGAILAVGLLAFSYWLIALATGAPAYATAEALFASPLGLLVLVGWTFAFFYHLLNGVRHLVWDSGRGFERSARRWGAWAAVGGSVLLSLGFWVTLWLSGRL